MGAGGDRVGGYMIWKTNLHIHLTDKDHKNLGYVDSQPVPG